jgi:hypothetical protein
MKAAILLAALFAFWLMGSMWQPDGGGGPLPQGGCTVDPNGRPICIGP